MLGFDLFGYGHTRHHRSHGHRHHAKRGRRFTFHGAFGSKEKARHKERQVHGFIRETTVRGHRRYLVLTANR